MARILVVDDDVTLAQVIEQILVDAGHVVATAVNGVQGEKFFGMEPFDLLLTDVVMPERDGLEVVCALREKSPDLKAIVMSGGSDRSGLYLKMAASLGAHSTLHKPFTTAELLRTVDNTLAMGPACHT